jgi:hypothetical protein
VRAAIIGGFESVRAAVLKKLGTDSPTIAWTPCAPPYANHNQRGANMKNIAEELNTLSKSGVREVLILALAPVLRVDTPNDSPLQLFLEHERTRFPKLSVQHYTTKNPRDTDWVLSNVKRFFGMFPPNVIIDRRALTEFLGGKVLCVQATPRRTTFRYELELNGLALDVWNDFFVERTVTCNDLNDNVRAAAATYKHLLCAYERISKPSQEVLQGFSSHYTYSTVRQVVQRFCKEVARPS